MLDCWCSVDPSIFESQKILWLCSNSCWCCLASCVPNFNLEYFNSTKHESWSVKWISSYVEWKFSSWYNGRASWFTFMMLPWPKPKVKGQITISKWILGIFVLVFNNLWGAFNDIGDGLVKVRYPKIASKETN